MASHGILDRIGHGRLGRAARQAFAALLLALLVPDMAAAQSATRSCRQLEAALAGLSDGGGRAAPAQARRYDDAIARQRDEIGKARAQARRAGCDFAVMGGSAAYCGQINATLARMDKNLAQLQRKRAQFGGSGGGGDTRRERARILAALDANDCRAPRQAATPPAAQTRASGTVVFPPAPGRRNLSGNFRTLCVRTCDGYYFPISWSVSQAAFERDGKACQAMCPGTEVELHYHRIPDEEPQDMVSAATGQPYRQMSTAFLYKRPGASVPAACGCGAAAQEAHGFQTIGGDYESNAPVDGAQAGDATQTAAIPQPSERPDPAEDPETLATREGGLDAEALRRLATPPSRTSEPSGERPADRQIRVVGPVFLPDPEAAADRQAPAPAPVP